MPYRSGNILWCVAGLIVVLAMAIVGVKLSRAMRGATWRRRLIMAGMFTLASLGLGGIAGDLISADSKPADNAAGATTTSSPASAPATAPTSAPAEYKEDFTGKTLEQTDAWKYLDAVWAKTDVILMGDRGRFPFTKAGKGELLAEIEAITPRLTALAGAKLITPPEAKLLRLLNEARLTSIFVIQPADDRFINWAFDKTEYDWIVKRRKIQEANLKEIAKSGPMTLKNFTIISGLTPWINLDQYAFPRESYKFEIENGEAADSLNINIATTRGELSDAVSGGKTAHLSDFTDEYAGLACLRYIWSPFGIPSESVHKAPDCVNALLKAGKINEKEAKFFNDDIKICLEAAEKYPDKDSLFDDQEDSSGLSAEEIDAKIEAERLADEKKMAILKEYDAAELPNVAIEILHANFERMPPICGMIYEKIIRSKSENLTSDSAKAYWEEKDDAIMEKWLEAKKKLDQTTILKLEKEALAIPPAKFFDRSKLDIGTLDRYTDHLSAFRTVLSLKMEIYRQVCEGKYDRSALNYIAAFLNYIDTVYCRDSFPLSNENDYYATFSPEYLEIDIGAQYIYSDLEMLSQLETQESFSPAIQEKIFPVLALAARELAESTTTDRAAIQKQIHSILAKSKVEGTELDKTAQWRRLTTAWRDAELAYSGAKTDHPFFCFGADMLQGRLALAGFEIELLKNATLLDEHEATLLSDSLRWLTEVANYDSMGNEAYISGIAGCYFAIVHGGFSDIDISPEKIELVKKIASSGKIKPEVAQKIITVMSRGALEYRTKPDATEEEKLSIAENLKALQKAIKKLKRAAFPNSQELSQTKEWETISATADKMIEMAKLGNAAFAQRVELMADMKGCIDAIDKIAATNLISTVQAKYLATLLADLSQIATRNNPSDSNADTYRYPPQRPDYHDGSDNTDSALFLQQMLPLGFHEKKNYEADNEAVMKTCPLELIELHVKILTQLNEMVNSPQFFEHDAEKAYKGDLSTARQSLKSYIDNFERIKEQIETAYPALKNKDDDSEDVDSPETQPTTQP